MMKTRVLFAAAVAFALTITACTPVEEVDPNVEPNVEEQTTEFAISFEGTEKMIDFNGDLVALSQGDVEGGSAGAEHKNIFWAKPFATDYEELMLLFDGVLFSTSDKRVNFGSFFSNFSYDTPFDTWNGFAISANYNNTAAEMDYANQFCVWAGGAADGDNFAACYSTDPSWVMGKYVFPTIEFSEPTKVLSMELANSTVTATYAHTADFVIKIQGYVGEEATEAVEFKLVDIAAESVVADWTKVDCSALGAVDKVIITVDTTDSMAPRYFCVDNIVCDVVEAE